MSLRTFLLLPSLLLGIRLCAQVPVPVNPPPVPGTPPGFPPAMPVSPNTPPNFPPAALGNEANVPLQLLDTDVKDVLLMYEKWTGRHLIYSTQLTGPIRITISGQVPQSMAVKIIEMTLLLNGFNILPTEEPMIYKVTGTGQSPKSVGVPFVDREELLPAGEQTVMFLFKLAHADATELAHDDPERHPRPCTGRGVERHAAAQGAVAARHGKYEHHPHAHPHRAGDRCRARGSRERIHHPRSRAGRRGRGLSGEAFRKEKNAAGQGLARHPHAAADRADGANDPIGGVRRSRPACRDGWERACHSRSTAARMVSGPTEDSFVVGKVRITADKRTNRLHVVSRP